MQCIIPYRAIIEAASLNIWCRAHCAMSEHRVPYHASPTTISMGGIIMYHDYIHEANSSLSQLIQLIQVQSAPTLPRYTVYANHGVMVRASYVVQPIWLFRAMLCITVQLCGISKGKG